MAADLLAEVSKTVATLPRTLRLSAVTCAPNFETQKYLQMKKRRAALAGITLNVVELPEEATTEQAIACVEAVAKDSEGVVVQLPLPAQIDREAVLAAVPVKKDPDGFQYGKVDGACLPPVVGAIDEMSRKYNIQWEGKCVVVLGDGRLVGKPALVYALGRCADAPIVTRENSAELLPDADILISGIGQPHYITPDMLKEGVVVFDAGTSEEGGELVGDVHPDVADKAALFTPVPGGIGPMTIACLLRNVVILARQYK